MKEDLLNSLYFSLYFSFFYYIYKASPLCERLRNKINSFLSNLITKKGFKNFIGSKLSYLTKCAFCLSWWSSLFLLYFLNVGFSFPIFCSILSPIFYNLLLESLTNGRRSLH